MCQLPKPLQPKHLSSNNAKESFDAYQERVGTLLPNWPTTVLKDWLYRHGNGPAVNFGFTIASFRAMRFSQISMAVKDIPGGECTWAPGTYTPLITDGKFDYRWCKAHSHLADEPEAGGEFGHSNDQRKIFAVEHGTWPVPIILANNAKGNMCRKDGTPLQKPWHLLEGHNRLVEINVLKKDGKAAAFHDVWVVDW